ncbi:MAG: hypothetical protein HY291_15805 [Planctomycetes bacterium]|nr:hypothetical protein [Planctomycetota bacterium]
MTKLLDRAIKTLEKRPKKEQDAFAALVLEGIESEKKWSEAFAKSQDKLAKMVDRAKEEHRRGKTRPLEESLDLGDD